MKNFHNKFEFKKLKFGDWAMFPVTKNLKLNLGLKSIVVALEFLLLSVFIGFSVNSILNAFNIDHFYMLPVSMIICFSFIRIYIDAAIPRKH